MSNSLDLYLSNPLEREFEAWIVQRMQMYFDDLSIVSRIWAVSPTDESEWPADENIYAFGKLLGLQFKRAKLATRSVGKPEYSRLNWQLGNPKNQFELIQRHPEIFYCLPTFINRKWYKESLQHCIFWRPDSGDDNKNVRYSKIGNAWRWGYFVEKILDGTVGIEILKARRGNDYLSKLQRELRSFGDTQELVNTSGLYLLYIQFA